MRKIHFYHGCPWADGSIQQSDTTQEYFWINVTCFHCLDNKTHNDESSHWKDTDSVRFYNTRAYLNDL